MWYVGLDVHTNKTFVCILNEDGKRIKTRAITGPYPHVVAVLKDLHKGQRCKIVFEASASYGWLFEQLGAIATTVQVAHPGRLRLIFCSKRKSDRVDAAKLATLAYLDQVPLVHVPTLDVRAWRGLIEHRKRTVDKRTRAKNALRALLRTHVIARPKNLWSTKGMAWLAKVVFAHSSAAVRRDMLLEEIVHLTRQIVIVEKELARIAREHPGVALLQTIPGIGIRTAEAVMAYIDNPGRFRPNKSIGTYFGLVPCEDTSMKQRFGHITREGPSTVRRMLIEATWQSIRRSETIRAYFDRVQRGDKERKKKALVATAHHLLRVMLSMLLSGEAWRDTAA